MYCPQLLSRRRRWHPTPVLLPRKSHGWRSLVGCSPWGCEESDTTEQLHFMFTFMHWRRKWQPTPVFLPGESQGWGSLVAAVYGVTQSWTRLKWLSSSSSCFQPYSGWVEKLQRECMAHKAENIYYLALYWKTFADLWSFKKRCHNGFF